ncbi:MAG: ECF transporter S component [Acidobacteria bacterium]|nr:ECF transporter S component [Acidobacteriota bacterium]
MTTNKSAAVSQPNLVLPAFETKAIAMQIAFLASAAFLLPALAHATGLPTRVLLPMHWPVVLAGLCYGWRSGLLIGLAAPSLSFLLSGMPPVFVLPAMTVELAAYGLLAGLARQTFGLNTFASSAISLIGGRVVFLTTIFAIGSVSTTFATYLQTSMLPGIPAAIAQFVLLSLAANWWVGREIKK